MLFRKCDSLWISYLTYVHGKVLHDNNGAGTRKVHHKLFTKDRRFMQDRTDNANSSVFRNKLIYLICITLCRKISLANSASSELALANRILCLLWVTGGLPGACAAFILSFAFEEGQPRVPRFDSIINVFGRLIPGSNKDRWRYLTESFPGAWFRLVGRIVRGIWWKWVPHLKERFDAIGLYWIET